MEHVITESFMDSINATMDAVSTGWMRTYEIIFGTLYEAKEKLTKAQNNCANQNDPEATKQAMDDVQEAKKILAQTRKDHLKTIRQMELDNTVQVYEDLISEYAKSVEQNKFDNLRRSAQRAIDNNSNDFESYLEEIRQLNFDVLWNQDWFIVDRFKQFAERV